MSPSVEIYPFELKAANHHEYGAMNRHNNVIRHEHLPDDPPIPLEEYIQGVQNIPPFLDVRVWCAWDASHMEILGQGSMQMYRTEENQHLAPFDISVLPDYRCQGIGRRLLAQITEAAQAENRHLLMTETNNRVPGGEAFMKRLGAQKGLEAHVNQLCLEDLDRNLLDRWMAQARERESGFELGLWDGSYPQEQIAAIANLYDITNQQPFGDLEIEDMHMTPEQIRQIEQMTFARGYQRWTIYAIEKATGKFAGYTETAWNPNRPEILRQDMTGVFPEYRNKGLGRWMKAAMLARVLQERPEVRYVRTGNADSNSAMLKINNELGFKPYFATTLWQIELERVLDYLKEQ